MSNGRISRLRKAAGLDFDIFVTLLFRSWSIVAGGLMVVFVPIWFTQTEQGYYYTFASLLALQVFFELGVNQVVTQVVAHEAAHLQIGPGSVIMGPALHLGRLSSVVRLLHRWYLTAALLFILVVGLVGSIFFQHKAELPSSQWQSVWWLLVTCTAANLYLSPMLAVLEGCGRVGQIARLRLVQSILGYLLMWLGLAFGLGLWAIPAVPAVAALYTCYWLRSERHPLAWLQSHRPESSAHSVNWRTEVLPFQWRIALGWISGYFIFQLFTPLIFVRHGAAAAGRLGIALAIFNAMVTLGMSWVNAKVPAFAAHISRAQRGPLNQLFRTVLSRSLLFTATGCALVLGAVFLLHTLDSVIVERLADLPSLACLAIVSIANTFVFAAAAFMRAHKQEPMLLVSIVTGALTLAVVYYGSWHGVFHMMILYTFVTVLVTVPWTWLLLRRYLRLV